MNYRITGSVCIALALLADQATKAIALATPTLRNGLEVLPFLNLVYVRNDGVSFGILGGIAPWWTLVALTTAIVVGLLVWLWRAESSFVAAALGLIIGGALGNILDRVRHGAVTDFLDFHAAGYHWPAFNLADAAIFLGAFILILDSLRAAPEQDGSIDPHARSDV